MKPKTVTTIKYIGILLFLICVFQKPQEVSAYPRQPHMTADALANPNEDLNTDIYLEVVFHASDGNHFKALFVGMNGYEGNEFYITKQSNGLALIKWNVKRLVEWEKSWGGIKTESSYVYDKGEEKTDSSKYSVYLRYYDDIEIVAYGKNTKVYLGGVDITAPTPTTMPTPTPTPTPVPVAEVDANDAGLTDIFDAVMRIMNIPFSINGYEITFLQIFIYIALASGVLYLIFGGTRD